MEIQLEELIAKIKKDGVDAAETEAANIIDAAKKEAERIIAEAEAEADKILANAKNETERMVRSGEDSIRQAGRNLLISFRESVTKEINAILTKNVTAVYSSEDFAQLIVTVVEAWAKNPDTENLTVILNDDTLKALEETVLASLKEKMLGGITLKASNSLEGGFRISSKDGSAYYDYSAEAVVDMLSGYLSPKVASLMKEA